MRRETAHRVRYHRVGDAAHSPRWQLVEHEARIENLAYGRGNQDLGIVLARQPFDALRQVDRPADHRELDQLLLPITPAMAGPR